MIFSGVPDPALIVLVGAAGSGKTTLARLLANEDPRRVILSSDVLRGIIAGDPADRSASRDAFRILYRLTALRCERRLTTIIDSTSATQQDRLQLLAIAAGHKVPAVAVLVLPPLEVTLARNAGRLRSVPEDVVRRQHQQVTEAASTVHHEGFVKVTFVLAGPLPPGGCTPDRCLNGVSCYAPSCYGVPGYGRADQDG